MSVLLRPDAALMLRALPSEAMDALLALPSASQPAGQDLMQQLCFAEVCA